MGTSSSQGKAAGAWLRPPFQSNAEFKEIVELYLYSPSGPSWPVIGWSLPWPLPSSKADSYSVSQEVSLFYGALYFFTVFTITRNYSLSWARLIQFTPSRPISLIPFIIGSLSSLSNLCVSSRLSSPVFPTKSLYGFSELQLCYDMDCTGSLYRSAFSRVLEDWPVGCPETSVWSYQNLVHNNPGGRSSQLLRGGSVNRMQRNAIRQYKDKSAVNWETKVTISWRHTGLPLCAVDLWRHIKLPLCAVG